MILRLKQLLTHQTPLFSGMISLISGLVIILFYSLNSLSFIDNYFQDSQFLLRLNKEAPHPDIVLISISDKTTEKYPWPIPRNKYTQVIQKLDKNGAKVIGFNIMIDAPSNDTTIDQQLFDTIAHSKKIVLPAFYDYSTQKTSLPLPILKKNAIAMGNVAVYPDLVTRHIEAEIKNTSIMPNETYLPMGVELARIYLNISSEDTVITDNQLRFANKVKFPLESNLMRISYLGPPDYFPKVPFEKILEPDFQPDVKGKVVLIGTFDPKLGGDAATPFANETELPMYSTEVQAHIIQSLLTQYPIYHTPPWIIIAILIPLSVIGGFYLQRQQMSKQLIFNLSAIFVMVITGIFFFNLFNLQIDIAPFILLCIVFAIQMTVISRFKSSILLNNEIKALQDLEAQQPQSNFKAQLNQILLTLLHTGQGTWVSFRKYNAFTRELELVKSHHSDPSTDLTPLLTHAYISDQVEPYFKQKRPISTKNLPFKIQTSEASSGDIFFLPIYSDKQTLNGLLEIYYSDRDDDYSQLSFDLFFDLQKITQKLLNQKFWHWEHYSKTQGIPPGVEQQIFTLSSLNARVHSGNAFFKTVLKSTTHPIVVCSHIGEIRFYNENFVKVIKAQLKDSLVGHNILELMENSFKLGNKQWHDTWFSVLHRRRQIEFEIQTVNEEVYQVVFTPVLHEDHEVEGVVMLLTDITKLHQKANYDKLTGLVNRRYFDELLQQEYNRCLRTPDKPFSLILLDIDHFKRFNDTYGHQIGDDVLREVAEVMQNNVRRTDHTARYGGEEMAIILPDTDVWGAAHVAEKIRRKVAQIQLLDPLDQPIHRITASLGISEFRNEHNIEAIIRQADEALYSCKQNGRNRIYLFDGVNFEPYQTDPKQETIIEGQT